MSWWEEFKENASNFFDTGHWGQKEDEGPVSVPMESKEERIQALMQGDIELQRANQDLQIAQQQHAKAKEALKQAELESSSKRTESYCSQYNAAEAEMKSAKAAYDSAAAQETSETKAKVDALYKKWQKACNKFDALSTRSLWDAKNPLENFVPQHYKDDEAAANKALNKMMEKQRQAEANARATAEAKLANAH